MEAPSEEPSSSSPNTYPQKTDSGSHETPQPAAPISPEHQPQSPPQQEPAPPPTDVPPSTVAPTAAPRQTTPGVPSWWSASSERQVGHGASPDPSDRVFPIRSVLSVDTAGRTSGDYDYSPHLPDHSQYSESRPGTQRVDTTATDSSIHRAESGSQPTASIVTSPTHRSTARNRRNSPFTGPISSVQADAARHASSVPLPILQDAGSEPDEESNLADDASANQLDLSQGRATPSEAAQDSLVTTKFMHVMTDEGHAVITGRDGVLQRCEDEPIHMPGAVQGFGLLLAIREEGDGRFAVRYASENSERLIGYTPQQLFRLHNLLDIMTEEQQDNLLDHIDFIRDEDADPATNGPDVFSISVRPPNGKMTKLWCAIHINPTHPDLVICEFELDNDQEFPLRPPDELTPDVPEDTLQSNPTLEELTESTDIRSKPLRVLRSARKQRGEAAAMQVFDIMSQIQEQLASAPSLDKLLKILVGIVKELTGFHRVMIYQFDSSHNGKVVTELVDTTHTLDLYKGLHFPASDIPRQARDLYKLNKVRLLYDRDAETARLVCRSEEDLEVPLDMSHSYLRAMSPIHIKYLTNMAVRSSMSISINAFDELWGLIACHSYGPKGMRVSFPIRKMCRLVGDTASRNIERLSYASSLQARKLINTAPADKNPSRYIVASSGDLLKLFDAHFGMLSIQGEAKIIGKIEQSQEAVAILEYLQMRKMTSVVTSQDIREDFPDLRYAPGFTVLAGLLYVPLSAGGSDFIVFFRKGQAKEVKWAGNPYEKALREGTMGCLEPRTSFKTWHETVLGKCREWSEEQTETAAVLCLVYGKFIEVWRQKKEAAALQGSHLTRLLLANSAHEIRTPLNAVINYLEIALEGTLDPETRDNLVKSHSASKSLIYAINDLLDLTKTEEGQILIKDEIFDLSSCISEATDPFKNEAKRKGIEYEVVEHPGLPRFVYGDSRRLRQAIFNVVANAVRHTSNGSVKVELYVSEVVGRRVRVDILVQDTGQGLGTKRLEALFSELDQVDLPELEDDLHRSEENNKSAKSTEAENRTLGLGLAVVARIVRNMDGQLRLKSEEGKGFRFVIQVPFDIPDASPASPGDASQKNPHSTTGSSVASVAKALPTTTDGEVTLIHRGVPVATSNQDDPPHTRASETVSLGSQKSSPGKGSKTSVRSSRSDTEQLVNAIQTPLSLGEVPSGSPVHQGTEYATVWDTKTPIRPVKVSDEYLDQPTRPQQQQGDSSWVPFEATKPTSERPKPESTSTTPSVMPSLDNTELQVLLAEDDPINMRILRKRLEKAGHEVHHSVNGEECATTYRENSDMFDVVLMDMQMPIVDGLTSTKMIRSLEKSHEHRGHSTLAAHNGRVPIFAVSASLVERDKDDYVDAGFDGWILKPIDFKRLSTLLLGIVDDEVRTSCLYTAGEWECGGWFCSRQTGQPGAEADTGVSIGERNYDDDDDDDDDK